jgi:hypothetical protein
MMTPGSVLRIKFSNSHVSHAFALSPHISREFCCERNARVINLIWVWGEAEYFCKGGWTQKLPVGQISGQKLFHRLSGLSIASTMSAVRAKADVALRRQNFGV